MTEGAMRDRGATGDRSLAQKLALFWGAAFLLAGILGFIPGITTNFDDIKFAGNDSDAELLGLFQVSILHNIVHLLFGVGILMSRTWESARTYLLGSGIIYVVLLIYGLLVKQESDANFVPMNNGDDWLHLSLALGLLASYFLSSRDRDRDHVRTDRAVT
ncbi:MAG: DUF4383 domain-containing protein [Actinobacteria bacterium]|nr:DUF4383 domain-containing protein [Actinomycetota bacterium]